VWQAVGLSIALMAPCMAADINTQATATSVGRGVPLVFLIATVGVLLVADRHLTPSMGWSPRPRPGSSAHRSSGRSGCGRHPRTGYRCSSLLWRWRWSGLLTVIPVRGGTRLLLSVEGATVALILSLM